MPHSRSLASLLLLVLPLTACSSDDGSSGAPTAPTERHGQRFPDVVDASARRDADGTWTFSATLSSPYDAPERYADGWRVLSPEGDELGFRHLTHDHASEQPFTRSQAGILVPEGIEVVTIQARDLKNGWGGKTFELELEPPEADLVVRVPRVPAGAARRAVRVSQSRRHRRGRPGAPLRSARRAPDRRRPHARATAPAAPTAPRPFRRPRDSRRSPAST